MAQNNNNNAIVCDMNTIRQYIYMNNDVVCNYEMTDEEYKNLKLESSRNIILFVRQLKKNNTINQLIRHIEHQINVEHVNNMNNLMINFNIVPAMNVLQNPIGNINMVNGMINGVIQIAGPIPPVVPILPVQGMTYFSDIIQNTILNTYNTSNENWICPYQYNQLTINLQNIRDLLVVETNNLDLLSLNLRDSLSRYQKIKDYRDLLNGIMVLL